MTAPRERRSQPWLQTAGGRRVSVLTPLPDDVSIRDIAAHLAKIARFSGATALFYSVAQHSVIVSQMFGNAMEALYALLHDAHEAYLGDVTRPVKAGLFGEDQLDRLAMLAERHDYAIRLAVGLNPELPAGLDPFIGHADMIALATERRDLLADQIDWSMPLPPPLPQAIRPLSWDRAEQLFLWRFRELCALTGIDPDRTLRPLPPSLNQ